MASGRLHAGPEVVERDAVVEGRAVDDLAVIQNCCLLPYSCEAAECPSMRQIMPGANTEVTAPVPWRHASKARARALA
jgi:hypothetical protein